MQKSLYILEKKKSLYDINLERKTEGSMSEVKMLLIKNCTDVKYFFNFLNVSGLWLIKVRSLFYFV